MCAFREDLWVREGKILNPEKLFFDEEGFADHRVDCGNKIIAPGFIDVQLNGKLYKHRNNRSSLCLIYDYFVLLLLSH